MTKYLVNDVMKQKSIIRISAGIWPLINASSQDLVRFSQALDLPDDYIDSLPDHLSEYLGSEAGTTLFHDEVAFESSFVLDTMSMSDSNIMHSFCFLSSYAIAVGTLMLIVFRAKMNSP